MNKCIWCNIPGEEEQWILYESLWWKIYLANKQDYIGRCVVVLKRHCPSLSDLTEDEWIDLKHIINLSEKVCKEVLNCDLCNWSCLMNDFYKADNPNPHLHIHLRPRCKEPVLLGNCVYKDDDFAHHYKNHKNSSLSFKERKILFDKFFRAFNSNNQNM